MGKLMVLGTVFLMVGLIFTGFIYILGDFQLNYGFQSTSNYTNIINSFNVSDLEDNAQSQQQELEGGLNSSFNLPQTGLLGGAFSFIDTSFKSIGTAIKVFTASGETASDLIQQSGSVLGIPSWVISVFITLVLVSVLILIAGILMGRDW